MKVFVSSTFDDLRDYRQAAIRSLQQLGHEVVAMENFTAASAPPLKVVLERIEQCDAYLGLLAWRYGYVPTEEAAFPPDLQLPNGAMRNQTSITHMEYLWAKQLDKHVLAFLLDEAAPWPPQSMDAFVGQPEGPVNIAAGASIRELRRQLQQERIVSFFATPAEVEARVATAVTNLGMSRRVATNLVHLTNPLSQGSPVPDSSMFFAIRYEIQAASETGRRMSTIDIATPWWSTRLFYLAALAVEFTSIERIVVVKENDFVGMLSVVTVLDRFETSNRDLARFNKGLYGMRKRSADQDKALDAAQADFEKRIPHSDEENLKSMVTGPNLSTWFGDAMLSDAITVDDLEQATLLDLIRIQAYPNEFVPVHSKRTATATPDPDPQPDDPRWQEAPVALIDKTALNEQLAQQYLEELLDKSRLI